METDFIALTILDLVVVAVVVTISCVAIHGRIILHWEVETVFSKDFDKGLVRHRGLEANDVVKLVGEADGKGPWVDASIMGYGHVADELDGGAVDARPALVAGTI
jgi:hypothetical protein